VIQQIVSNQENATRAQSAHFCKILNDGFDSVVAG
jgi:hypothetical protein